MTAAARDPNPLYDPDEVVELRRDVLDSHRPPSNADVVAVATGLIPEPDPPDKDGLRYIPPTGGRHRERPGHKATTRKPARDLTVVTMRTLAAVLFAGATCGSAAFFRAVQTAAELSPKGLVMTAVTTLAIGLVWVWSLTWLVTIHPCACGAGYSNGRH